MKAQQCKIVSCIRRNVNGAILKRDITFSLSRPTKFRSLAVNLVDDVVPTAPGDGGCDEHLLRRRAARPTLPPYLPVRRRYHLNALGNLDGRIVRRRAISLSLSISSHSREPLFLSPSVSLTPASRTRPLLGYLCQHLIPVASFPQPQTP